jgi:protein CWC15
VSEVKKINLRAELIAAEADARAKKRKAAGLPVEDESSSVVPVAAIEDEETKKRRKVLQEALEMDKDADSDEDDDADADGPKGGEAKYVVHSGFIFSSSSCTYCNILPSSNSGDHTKSGENGNGGGDDNMDEDGDEDEEDDDEEDETAELFRELEKIKRERAAEKERVEQAENAVTEAEREAQIATANPLLNLAAALGNAPGINTTAPGTFAVKRRWDDGAFTLYVCGHFFVDLNERLSLPILQTSFSRIRRQKINPGRVSL